MKKKKKRKKATQALLFELEPSVAPARSAIVERKDRKNLYCRVPGPKGHPVLRSCFTRIRDRAEAAARSWGLHFERKRSNPSPAEGGSILTQGELTP